MMKTHPGLSPQKLLKHLSALGLLMLLVPAAFAQSSQDTTEPTPIPSNWIDENGHDSRLPSQPPPPIRVQKPWAVTGQLSFPKLLGVEGLYQWDAQNALMLHTGFSGLFSVGGGYRHYNELSARSSYWEINSSNDALASIFTLNGLYGWENIHESGYTDRFGFGAGLAYVPNNTSNPYWVLVNIDIGVGYRF